MLFRLFKSNVISTIAALSIAVVGVCGEPAQPAAKSSIGYVTVIAPDAAVGGGKLSCQPGTILPILETSQQGTLLLAASDDSSGVVLIPNEKAPLLGAWGTPDGKGVVFERGGTLPLKPLPLSVGEELSIKVDMGDRWLCQAIRLGVLCPVIFPKTPKVGSFSKRSAREIFLERQKSFGLSEWKGKWINSENAAFFAEEERKEEVAVKSREDTLLAIARKGYVVKKGGHVLQGKFKGRAGGKIYFVSDAGDEWWLTPEMMDDGTFEELLARAHIAKASTTLDKACAAGRSKEKRGEAILMAKSATRLARLVPKSLEIESLKALRVEQKAAAFVEKTEAELKTEGLSAHDGKVLPAAELEWRMKEGQTLFKKSHWIYPSQVCSSCEGKGRVVCPKCLGEETVSVRCPKCVGGMIVCPVCAGSAQKPCPKCNAAGFVDVRCAYCGGDGSIENPMPTVSGGGGNNVVISPGGAMIVTMGGWFPRFIYHQQVLCFVCGGTGMNRVTCPMCNSTTRVPCPVKVKCQACGGRGTSTAQCPDCKGEGRIQCRTCGGNGFVGGDIQWKPEIVP